MASDVDAWRTRADGRRWIQSAMVDANVEVENRRWPEKVPERRTQATTTSGQ
jgi:hypothetical protein